MSTTIRLTPSASLPTGFESKATFNNATKSLDNGPIYVAPTLIAPKSFILELVIGWTATIPNAPLATKPGGFSIATRNGKLLHSWTSCQGDEFNLSELEVAGITTLRPGTRYTIRYEYDATTGQVIVKINGLIEIQYYRMWPPSDIKWDSQKLQLLVGQTGTKLYGATISSNKPTLPTSLTLATVVANGFVHIERPDLTALNTTTRIEIRNPHDALVSVQDFVLKGEMKVPYTLGEMAGIYTVTISNSKGYMRTVTVPVGSMVSLPVGTKGYYNVRAEDFPAYHLTKANMACSDWVMNREPLGSASITGYLKEAQKHGIKLSVVANYNAARTRAFNEPTTAIHSYLVGDEVGGYFERFLANYNAIRVESSVPVAMSLNNFTRIREAAECCDFMFLNIYNCRGNLERISTIVKMASKYRPVVAVLASYSSERSDGPTIKAQIQTAMDAGAIGTVIFEFDHREKSGGSGWYLPIDNSGVIEGVKEGWE